MNIEQHAAEIAAMYATQDLRRLWAALHTHLERRETRRLPEYVIRVPRAEQRVGLVVE
jgi:hypothetical protein